MDQPGRTIGDVAIEWIKCKTHQRECERENYQMYTLFDHCMSNHTKAKAKTKADAKSSKLVRFFRLCMLNVENKVEFRVCSRAVVAYVFAIAFTLD